MTTIDIPLHALRRLVTTAKPCAGKDDLLPIFTGIRLYERGDHDDEPIFPLQICTSCGLEHPGLPCPAYDDDLFGGVA